MRKRRPLRRADGKPIDHSKISTGYAAKQTGNRGGINADLRWQDYHDKAPGEVKNIPITPEIIKEYERQNKTLQKQKREYLDSPQIGSRTEVEQSTKPPKKVTRKKETGKIEQTKLTKKQNDRLNNAFRVCPKCKCKIKIANLDIHMKVKCPAIKKQV